MQTWRRRRRAPATAARPETATMAAIPAPAAPVRPGSPRRARQLQSGARRSDRPAGDAARPGRAAGEIHGFGLLDPALARELAAAAAASPRTEVCVTVTSPEGYAIGHGCARPTADPGQLRSALSRQLLGRAPRPAEPDHPRHRPPGLATPRRSHWPVGFHPARQPSPADRADPPDGYGTWTLVLPGGRRVHRAARPGAHLRVRPPVRDARLPAERPAPPPGPGPRRHLHVPALQPARPRVGLRACAAV